MKAKQIFMFLAAMLNIGVVRSQNIVSIKETVSGKAENRINSVNQPDTIKPVSMPGVYKGYAQEVYPHLLRTSRYIQGYDGTRLVLELNQPSTDGTNAITTPLPVLLLATRYGRQGAASDVRLRHILKCGYVLAILELRGSGNSFGSRAGDFTPEEAKDCKKIVEWLASQPWSTGKVGMLGSSYSGVIQLLTAAYKPKGLIAIAPTVNDRDFYLLKFPNGVFSPEAGYDKWVKLLDVGKIERPVELVERDIDGTPLSTEKATELRNLAFEEHQANMYRDEIFGYADGKFPSSSTDPVYRDSDSPLTKNKPFLTWSSAHYARDIAATGVHIYEFAGWYDGYVNQQLIESEEFKTKIIVGPWAHGLWGTKDFDVMAEHHRWFDYQLKGIDNGIQHEKRVYYYTKNAPKGQEWQYSDKWPLPQQRTINYYFGSGPSNTINSVNDGLLTVDAKTTSGQDNYTSRYDISVFGGKFSLLDRSWNGDMRIGVDEKGLTYTSPSLAADVQVTGHPVVHLNVASTASDAYFFVWLEDIDESNKSTYVTEGKLKASHRVTATSPPENKVGIPYHPSLKQDIKPLNVGEVTDLAFDLFPTSFIFKAGHRIRVTLSNASEANFPVPAEWKDQKTVITIHHSSAHLSFIALPVVQPMIYDHK